MEHNINQGLVGVIGAATGSIITFSLTSISGWASRRRDKKTKQAEENKNFLIKSISIIDELSKAYFVNYDIKEHFYDGYSLANNPKDDLPSYIDILTKTRPYGNLPKKSKLHKHKLDVLFCSGVNSYNQFTMIDEKVNSSLDCAKSYKDEYLKLFDNIPGTKEIDGKYVSVIFSKDEYDEFGRNVEKLQSLVNLIGSAITFADDNIAYLLHIMQIFIEENKYLPENFCIELVRSNSSLTIKRKVKPKYSKTISFLSNLRCAYRNIFKKLIRIPFFFFRKKNV